VCPLLFMHSPTCLLTLALPLHAALPLVHITPGPSPSPCMQPFPLYVALPLVCSIAWAEGTRGVLSILCPPACRGGQWVGCVNQEVQWGQPCEWNDLHKGGGRANGGLMEMVGASAPFAPPVCVAKSGDAGCRVMGLGKWCQS